MSGGNFVEGLNVGRARRLCTCTKCRAGPMTLAEFTAHVCDVDDLMVHYSIQPGWKMCGANFGRENYDGVGITCDICATNLKRRLPK